MNDASSTHPGFPVNGGVSAVPHPGRSRRSLLRAAGGSLLAAGILARPPAGAAGAGPTINVRAVATPSPRQRPARERDGIIGGSRYRIRIPAGWNGTLVLYSQADPVSLDAADPVTDVALLERGFGLAGTALNNDFGWQGRPPVPTPRPWPVEDAIREQGALLDLVEREIGRPARTITWGNSLSGLVAAGLLEAFPGRFAGALPRCGLLAGGAAVLNTFLDLHVALEALLAPGSAAPGVVDPADADIAIERAGGLLRGALASPEGRARVALAASLGQIPDRFGPRSTWPNPEDHAARATAQAAWLSFFVLPLSIRTRANAAKRAGGNPTWNEGIAYGELFERAPLRGLVEALYDQAGVDLAADLRALDETPRTAADSQAVDYLRRYVVFRGEVGVPVLTLHETADGAAIPANEAAYAAAVAAAGEAPLLRQVYVDRASHCSLTPAELLTAFDQLVRRIDTDAWDDDALAPAPLNEAAVALGPDANQIVRQRPEQEDAGPAGPSFVAFEPPPLLRPFDARTPDPAATAGLTALAARGVAS